jgi:molecular chaperone GrpE
MSSPEDTNAGPVIRDLRRIDPRTGQVRNPGTAGPDASGAARGPGKPARPGKHAVSKPGGAPSGGRSEEADGPDAGQQGPAAGAGTGAGQRPDGERAGAAAQAGPGQAGPRPAGPGSAGPGSAGPGRPAGAAGGEQELASRLAERTADLQRVTAEYANYRKRVDRDRMAVREQALANVLSALLPVLDDIGRAREAGELVGGFKSVADSLDSAVTKLGLGRFGTEGEAFDPKVHEALTHSYSAGVTEATCVQILQPGYKVGDRILRPARVAVAEPDDSVAPDSGAMTDTAEPRPAGGAGSQENREED